jgi:hypothetical protein
VREAWGATVTLLFVISMACTYSAWGSMSVCTLRHCREYSAMLLSFPLPFAQELNACAIHQQIPRFGPALVRQSHLHCFGAAPHGADVDNPPIQTCQM